MRAGGRGKNVLFSLRRLASFGKRRSPPDPLARMNDHHTHLVLHSGDPTILGWVTFAAYLAGAVLCWRAYRANRTHPRPLSVHTHAAARDRGRLALWWLGVGAMLFLLGLNKQLDLQTLLTQQAREMALDHGWYASRRVVQGFFVIALAAGCLALMLALAVWLRKVLRDILPAVLGSALLLAYVLARAALFHKVTVDHGAQGSLWLLELAGITLVAANARAHETGTRK